MSVQSAKDFITHANHDDAIRSIARERFTEIESVGSEHGYEFSRDDFAQAMRERRGSGADIRADQLSNCQCGHHPDSDPDPGNCQCGTEDDEEGGPTNCQCGKEDDEEGGRTNCQCGGTPPPHKPGK